VEIEVKKASDIVSDYIESLIRKNNYLPGERLPSIKEWAERLEVSVGTIREATHILKTKGLIEVRQGEGTFVRKIELKEIAPMMNIALIQMDDLRELMDFRKILEIGTVQLAAQNRTLEDLEELKSALDEINTGDKGVKEEADFRFHSTIAMATHNSFLLFLFQSISPAIKSLMNRYSVDMADQNWNDHNLIFEGIKNQDVQQSMYLMDKHLSEGRKRAFPESI
jgi:GntR family transcriptional regulator, transcriptional repressor for pyruvate dehydrogenase complex